ncbi:hypothetical protein ANO14919_093940 [Xylariales sp. No.14919]|nr:hypothetical protein ANO14919_093940 [Xylariales sp. No.14919]
MPEAVAAHNERIVAQMIAEMERDDSDDEPPLPGYNDDCRPPPYIVNDYNTWDDIDLCDGLPPIRRLRSPPPRYRRARRLPRPLANYRRIPVNSWPYILLRYYENFLEERIYKRVQAEYQVEFVAHRILTTRSVDEIKRSVYDPSLIDQYIDEAINFAEAVYPRLFVLFQLVPPHGRAY